MKKRFSYGLYLANEGSRAVKLSCGEDSPYVIEWIEPLPEGGSTPTRRLKELCGQGSRVFQLLPNEEVSLLIAALPPMKRKQMVAALQGILQRDKGGRLEEWIVDYWSLPERDQKSGQQVRGDVAAMFVRKLVLEHQFGLAKDLGIQPKGLLPGYLALEQLFRRHRPTGIEGKVCNLVHLGRDEQFLCVADEHCMLFTRPLPADLSGGIARDEYVERLAAEIERSNFFAQQAERSMQVESIAVCGDPNLTSALVEKLSKMSSFEVVDWRAEELFAADIPVAWENLIPLAAAAAAFHASPYNLLPQEVQEGKRRAMRRYAVTAVAAFGATVVPIMLVGGVWTGHVQREYLSAAKKQVVHAERRAGDAAEAYLYDQALKSRQLQVDRYSQELPDLAALLRDIAVRTPATVVYTSLDVQEDMAGQYRLLLQGESVARDGTRAHETFLSFLAALADCRRIREIREPTYLEISGVGEDGPPRSRVLFSLEYAICKGGET